MMRRLAKDVAVYGAGDMAFRFVTFAVFPIYAHMFSVEQFGIMTLVATLAGLVSVILTLGMSNALGRYYWDPETAEDQRPVLVSTGLSIMVVWSLAVTALLLFVTYQFAGVLDARYDIPWVLVLLALSSNVPSMIILYCMEVLRLHFSPWRFSLMAGVRSLSSVALGLFFVIVLDLGLLGLFLGQFIALALTMPLGLWMVRDELRWRFDRPIAREILLFGYPFVFVGLATWVFGSMDRWMLGEMSDNTNVGIYSIGYKFAMVLTFVTTAFAQAWNPLVIKWYAEDPNYRERVGRMFTYWFFGLAFIGLGVSVFGFEILWLTTPEPYWPAATIIGVLAMGLVLMGTTQFTALGISLARRSSLLSTATWITAGVNLALNLVLIPLWGALGAGIATFAAYAVLTGLYLRWSQRLHNLPLETKKLLFSLSIVVLAPFLVAFMNTLDWSAGLFAAKIGVCALVLLLAFATGTVRVSDLRKLTRREAI